MSTRDIAARLAFRRDVFVRGAGFALAGITVFGALAAGSALRQPRVIPPPAAEKVEQDGKDQTRVVIGQRSPAAQASYAPADVSVWHPGKMENASVGQSAGAPILPGGQLAGEWREQEFSLVAVVDGRTFSAGGVTIRLAGLELPPPDQVCRTLDNRLEQCATRAATQLELLTRSRRLACRYRMATSSEAVGSCRIGALDLADRMIRTGYVRVAEAGKTVIATAGESTLR
jgi:endonuclease YncB( thermonuclease family)